MINNILSASDAKTARMSLGLSQANVAELSGISRTKLALFEVNKYILDEQSLTVLKQFYESQGYEFVETIELAQQSVQPDETKDYPSRDAIQISSEMSKDEVDEILSKIETNEELIQIISQEQAEVSFWTSEPKTEGLEQLQQLYARNYELSRMLRGLPTPSFTPDSEYVTNGQLFNQWLRTDTNAV